MSTANTAGTKSEHASAQVVAQELDIKINPVEKVRVHQDGSVSNRQVSSNSNFETGSSANLTFSSNPNSKTRSAQQVSRGYISVHVVRALHQRDRTCRWTDAAGHVCGSTYQLQIDHIIGLVDGGTDAIENLELKCGVHNRRKFELERLARL